MSEGLVIGESKKKVIEDLEKMRKEFLRMIEFYREGVWSENTFVYKLREYREELEGYLEEKASWLVGAVMRDVPKSVGSIIDKIERFVEFFNDRSDEYILNEFVKEIDREFVRIITKLKKFRPVQ